MPSGDASKGGRVNALSWMPFVNFSTWVFTCRWTRDPGSSAFSASTRDTVHTTVFGGF